ncbi:unnamed protein product [Orchesella dallaii]|uniref:Uncharacterized protein n=1 Tax=Orchesella dallaii TaxID=48710 RepID=A0ABP1Q0N3_9HEXA
MEVEEEQPRTEMVDGHAGQNSSTSGNVSIIINLYGMDASVAGTGMPIGSSSNSRGVIITMQSAHPIIALDENVGDTVSKKKSNFPSNANVSSEEGYDKSTTYSFTEDFEELEEIDEDVEVISESAFDSAIRFSSEMEVDEEQPITEMTGP